MGLTENMTVGGWGLCTWAEPMFMGGALGVGGALLWAEPMVVGVVLPVGGTDWDHVYGCGHSCGRGLGLWAGSVTGWALNCGWGSVPVGVACECGWSHGCGWV